MNAAPPTTFDVAIIGDGFCSMMTAAHLVRGQKPLRMAVVGEATRWGAGIAYGRARPEHLLNVPVEKMGPFPNDPEGFLRWAEKNIEAPPSKGIFAPRALYARYLDSIAAETIELARKNRHVLTFVPALAKGVNFKDGVFSISVTNGEMLRSLYLALTTGIPAPVTSPNDPENLVNPWAFDFDSLKGVAKPVIILGTGLTMIDVVASLERGGFKGEIHAVSRRGLLPEMHGEAIDMKQVEALASRLLPLEGGLSEKLRRFRANARTCEMARISWRGYVDYIRPQIPALWNSLSTEEQKKFLRCIAPYWNIRRHRQPRESFEMLERLRKERRLFIHKGGADCQNAAVIFNCRGPDYSLREAEPLFESLFARNLARRHSSGIGLALDDNLSACGAAEGKLFVAGALTCGKFLDSASVPELRGQCEKIARVIFSSANL